MEFIFDQGRSGAGSISNNPAIDDFKNNSPIRRAVSRKPIASIDEIEISGARPTKRRRKSVSKPPVKYVSKAKRAKKKTQGFQMSWTKFGWIVCGCLMLRLVFMESGLIDFYKMDSTIVDKEQSLVIVKKDNTELRSEIRKIKTSPKYQRKVAREHLGVISSNEYLVIFAKDS